MIINIMNEKVKCEDVDTIISYPNMLSKKGFLARGGCAVVVLIIVVLAYVTQLISAASSGAYFGASRTPISEQAERLFRSKSNGHFGVVERRSG